MISESLRHVLLVLASASFAFGWAALIWALVDLMSRLVRSGVLKTEINGVRDWVGAFLFLCAPPFAVFVFALVVW